MYALYLNTLYSLGFKEQAIARAVKCIEGLSTIKMHDAAQDLLSRNAREILDAYRRMNLIVVPVKKP